MHNETRRAEGQEVKEVNNGVMVVDVRGSALDQKILEGMANVQLLPSEKTVEQQLAEMPDEVPDPDISQFPPFHVINRSRAEKIVEILYGKTGRLRFPKKENVGQVQIVLQQGPRAVVIRQAPTLDQLLSEPVESYIKGGSDLKETERRIAEMEAPVRLVDPMTKLPVMSNLLTLGVMSFRALSQFPAFKARRQKEYERLKADLLAKNKKKSLSELADEASKELAQSAPALG